MLSNKDKLRILAIESSCDETAAAVISMENLELRSEGIFNSQISDLNPQILSNIVSTQIDLHKQYGGVFPEIASRAHAEQIIPVIQQALERAENLELRTENLEKKIKPQPSDLKSQISDLGSVDLIAVTTGPGLIGSLLVGVNTAKSLAYANNKPIISINHWLGHIYSCFAGINNSSEVISNQLPVKKPTNNKLRITNNSLPQFPLLALIVSGGHTGLVLMKSHTDIQTIGETLDDAAGEAFDKVAKLLGLGYPGGPAIAEAAAEYQCHSRPEGITGSGIQNHNANWIPDDELPLGSRMTIKFPRAMLDRPDFNFSFSGLKTSVLNKVKELSKTKNLKPETYIPVVAYEFQQACIDILIGKTLKAAEIYKPKSILLCGGVSANKELREQMAIAIENWKLKIGNSDVSFHFPEMKLCGDNAVMIGLAAAYQINAGVKPTTFSKISANSNSKLG